MATVLSRLLAVGIVAGGFALTGDLGRLAARCREVIDARDVPRTPTAPSKPAAAERVAGFRPPPTGLARVDLAATAAGDRIVVWLAAPRGSAGGPARCLLCDVIDPTTAEAVLSEAVSFAADGSPRASVAAPCRVRLRPVGGGAMMVGGSLDLERQGTAAGEASRERIGPIAALDLAR